MSKVHKNRLSALLYQADLAKGKSDRMSLPKIHFLVSRGYICCRLQYKGQRLQRSTGFACQKADFDGKSLEVSGQPSQTRIIQNIRAHAHQLFAEIRLTERSFNLEQIWSVLAGNDSFKEQHPTLLQLFEKFLKTVQEQFEVGDIGKASHQKITGWDKLLRDFARQHYGPFASIDKVVPADAKVLDTYLKKQHHLSNNYTQHIVQHLKRILNYAVENEWIIRNPFMNFQRRFDFKKGEYLTEKELAIIENAVLFSPVLERIRDVFVFMCWTGLSYKDTQQLKPQHIVQTTEGDYYIIKTRQKSGTPFIVYLTGQCLTILESYKDDKFCQQRGQLLPLPANQKINAYLKQIAGIANIKKAISCHTARRTFATILHTKGVDEQYIKSAMGHTNIAMTHRHYIHTQPDAIVKALKSKLS